MENRISKKILLEYFEDILSGKKKYELRLNVWQTKKKKKYLKKISDFIADLLESGRTDINTCGQIAILITNKMDKAVSLSEFKKDFKLNINPILYPFIDEIYGIL